MKKFKLTGCIVALLAIVMVNAWNVETSLKSSELRLVEVEAIANPEDIGPKHTVNYWYVWGYEREDGSGWKKKECVHDVYYYDEKCCPGDKYSIDWGVGGCPFELLRRFWCYQPNNC